MLQMTILVDNIAISVLDTFSVCNQTFVDLGDELPIQSLNGNTGDLLFRFYEDSLSAANQTSPPMTPSVAITSGTYWVRAEKQAGGPCFDVKSFELVFDTTPEIAPIPTQELCNSTCFQLLDLPINTPAGNPISNLGVTFYDNEAAALAGNIDETINTEICSDGTYWVRAASSPSCFAVASFLVNFSAAPDIDDVTLMLDCNFGCVKLAELRLTEKNGINEADLFYSFFTTEAEATDPNASPLTLAELEICSPTEIWIKVTNLQNGCFDIAQTSITGMPLATATLTGDQVICAGEAAALDIVFTGEAPFNLRYTDEVRFFDTLITTNNFLLLVSPNSTRTYSLFFFVDNNGCVGNPDGTATVTVNDLPIINNLMENCSADNTDYTLSFDIIGNDTYTVQGVTGTLTGNTFTSDPIPSGTSFNLEIAGSNGCSSLSQQINFSCACNAVVDIMDTQAINVCDRAAAIGTYLGPGGENLDNGTLFFVLHDSPTTTLGNVIAYEDVPIFTFDDATMEHGVTYYLSAVITRTDLLGEPILDVANNSCLVTAAGAPVTFYAIPEANLSLSTTTLCQGTSANLTFNIDGVGPFDVIFFDGAGLRPLMDISDGHTISVMPEFSTNFYIESVSQSGINNCESMPLIANNELTLTVFEVPTIQNVTTSCNKEGTRLVLNFEVIGGDLATYMVDGMNGTFKGNEFTSDSIPHNTPYTISVTDVNNCPTIPVMGVAECYCIPDIDVEISTVKAISCRGEKDAILLATPINGAAPYSYFWSTGSTTQSINNIAPGKTSVSITDASGCLVTDSITLIEPASITSSVNILDPSCFGENDGVILFVQVEGGTGDYSFSFNNSPFRAEGQREGLAAGVYEVGIQDENGCQFIEEITLNNPPQLDVSLGDNKELNLGDSITLNPQVNDTEITLEWESEDATICLDCPNPTVKPTTSQRYKVTVVNDAGCVASAQILVQVQNQQRLFIPSAFSPNGDGSNDILYPFMGSEIQGIPMFRVFNRWGELVFENTDMAQSASLDGWDGTTLTGRKAPPGVYIYYTEINFKNGTTEVQTGDVTLIR
ncbi:MAG: gliding motility-associated C-terminal domain-containing protein [Saprospiraceae bacterium]